MAFGSEEPRELVHQHVEGYDKYWHQLPWHAQVPELPYQKKAKRKLEPAANSDIRALGALLAYDLYSVVNEVGSGNCRYSPSVRGV